LKVLQEKGLKIVQGTRPLASLSRLIKWNGPTPEDMVDNPVELFEVATISFKFTLLYTDGKKEVAGRS